MFEWARKIRHMGSAQVLRWNDSAGSTQLDDSEVLTEHDDSDGSQNHSLQFRLYRCERAWDKRMPLYHLQMSQNSITLFSPTIYVWFSVSCLAFDWILQLEFVFDIFIQLFSPQFLYLIFHSFFSSPHLYLQLCLPLMYKSYLFWFE